jgi:hypothetical protein
MPTRSSLAHGRYGLGHGLDDDFGGVLIEHRKRTGFHEDPRLLANATGAAAPAWDRASVSGCAQRLRAGL